MCTSRLASGGEAEQSWRGRAAGEGDSLFPEVSRREPEAAGGTDRVAAAADRIRSGFDSGRTADPAAAQGIFRHHSDVVLRGAEPGGTGGSLCGGQEGRADQGAGSK